jgi:8-oxo-dGTP pyrophosphatase MutT (NUDIX family)
MQRMEINRETTAPIPQAAATVLMLRDGEQGPEAFLVRRHEKSNVHGGVYVFPGGKVDDDDFSYPVGHLDQDPSALQAALNEAETDARTAAGIFVAAVRETFEECGVLLARGDATAVTARDTVFSRVVRDNRLTLRTADLLPWSRWITPTHAITPGRRFDTRFFVLRVPPDQAARHDDHETIDSVWLTPREALERYWRGEIALVPPQIMSLSHIATHASVDAILDEARSRPPYLICPAVHDVDGQRVMAYPSDPLHPSPTRVMPGPTRLAVVKGRLEPPGGFEAFFASTT